MRWHWIVVVTSILLGGCSSMDVSDMVDTRPTLDLFDYFDGKTRAWGMFQGRNGDLKRRFTVDISGEVEGDVLTLTEDFIYSDGEVAQRVWRIRRIDRHRYVGEADDVVGEASGNAYGSVLNWRYVLRLPYKESSVEVAFDDWMYLHPNDVLMNRAKVKKFGFTVGEVTLVFMKVPS